MLSRYKYGVHISSGTSDTFKGTLHYVSSSFGLDYGIPYGTYIILVGRLFQNAHYKWRNNIT